LESNVPPDHSTRPDHRLHRIVDAVLDLPDAERERAIVALCGGDPSLEASARRAVAPGELANLEREIASMTPTAATAPDRAAASDRIGPYRLLERLGEGAFGEVYVAEQSEPVRRKVAIKILKPGMGSRQVIARFEAERQALAIMDHPHIARIFDAGTTPLGLPYFVMELVRGLPITAYCTEHRLSLRERLALFIPVCEAVQHAHQRGIIHRDLKPGNVLVTVLDGKPVPKVIDFGIAKALGPTLTDVTIYTQFRQFIGTPAYMSPEQMALSAVDVDTRSDVYSLGAVLYELVCGVPPFDAETLLKAGLDELRRVVRETDPPAPSTRVSSIDAGTRGTLASAMQVPADRLSGQLKGEVDWIVAKATERDRARRYQSPLDLAADLSAYLDGRAVTAGPRSRVYLARKFARRHRVPLAIGSAAALGLVATTIGTSIGLSREAAARAEAVASAGLARENEARANAQREQAERNMKIADGALEFLTDVLRSADPGHAGGRADVTVAEMLDRAVGAAGRGVDTEGRPLEPELVRRVRRAAAIVYYWQGEAEKGREQARKMLERAEADHGPDSLEAADALSMLVGWYWFGRADPKEGERVVRRAMAIYERHGRTNEQPYRDVLHQLNLMLHAQFRYAEAVEISLALARQYDAMPDPPIVSWETAHHDVAINGLNLGRAQRSLVHIERCLEICRTRLPADRLDEYTARPYASLAAVLLALDRPAEAEAAARRSMELHTRLRGPDHPYPMYERFTLFSALVANNKLDEAEELLAAIDRLQARQGQAPGVFDMARRAILLRRRGMQEKALEIWNAAEERVFGGPTPRLPRGTPFTAGGFAERLGCLTDLGRAGEGLASAAADFEAVRATLAATGDDVPENSILRPFAAELLRAYEAVGDAASLAAARALRERYPGLNPAPGFAPVEAPR
jgi:serine/threonine protein kinase